MDAFLNEAQIGHGWVMHARPGHRHLAFKYPIFNLFLPLDRNTKPESVRLPKFFAVHPGNYLNGQAQSLVEGLFEFLSEKLHYVPERVVLQTLPSMWGYVFNPVSFWYCYKDGKVDAILSEVNNTFGDRHFYFLRDFDLAHGKPQKLEKVFHVSPFFDISGHYEFIFQLRAEKNETDATIRYFGPDQKLRLDTRIVLQLSPLREARGWRLVLQYGWMTVLVMLRIHWQALRLWWAGMKFHKRPSPPPRNVTT